MKPKKQNNPVVLGILGVAFVFILLRIFKTLTGGSDLPLPAAKPDAAAQSTIGAAQSGTPPLAVQSAVMRTRDPFHHPYLVRVAQEEADKQNQREGKGGIPAGTQKTGTFNSKIGQGGMSIGLPNVTPPTYTSKPVLGNFATNPNREQNAPATQRPNDPSTQSPNTAERWHVTAILGGKHPTAVLESPEMSPRTVAVGDELQGFRIVAIRSDQIVVASARTVLTLPLETHGDNKAENDSKLSQSNDTKVESKQTQEIKALTSAEPPKSTEKPNHGKTSN